MDQNQSELDENLAEKVSEVLAETESLIPDCIHEESARDLQVLMQNQSYRQALVRLYSVLLDVDMRVNPDFYVNEEADTE